VGSGRWLPASWESDGAGHVVIGTFRGYYRRPGGAALDPQRASQMCGPSPLWPNPYACDTCAGAISGFTAPGLIPMPAPSRIRPLVKWPSGSTGMIPAVLSAGGGSNHGGQVVDQTSSRRG